MTEITSSINSRVRLWKINHSGPGCSFYEFYEWYIFQYNTRVYIIISSIYTPCLNNGKFHYHETNINIFLFREHPNQIIQR